MSDYHTSYSDAPGNEDIVDVKDPRHPLISQGDKYNGCSDCATKCLKQMERLAELFRHSTLGVPHLVAAMTLVPCAFRAFQLRNIDVTTAFRSAMLNLIEMERVKPGVTVAAGSSSELNDILILAGNIAKERDYQEVSVHDLLTALNSLPPDAPAAEAIRGGSRQAQVHNLHAELEMFARNLTQNVSQQIQDLLPASQQPVIDFQTRSDVSDIKRELQSLVALITEIRSRADERVQDNVATANENAEPAVETPSWLRNVFGSGAR